MFVVIHLQLLRWKGVSSHTMKILTVVMTMGALVSSGYAQDEKDGRDGRPGASGRGATATAPKGAAALLAALDRNGDGKLQQAEIDMATVVLRRMDRDEDGTVSEDEMVAPPQGRRPGATGAGQGGRPGEGDQRRRFQGFDQLDKNNDGKISKDEAPDRMKERFDQMDANSDGVLDKAEQEEVLKRIRERAGQGGGQRTGQESQGGGRRRQEDPPGGEKPKRPAQSE